MNPTELLYAGTHEWLSVNDDIATIGISNRLADALTDMVYIDFPELGQELEFGKPAGSIESVNSVRNIYSPVSGEVVEVNSSLTVAALASHPIGAGWLFRLHMSDLRQLDELMDWIEYQDFWAEAFV